MDAVWLSPFYTSPQHDAGYDVADYRDVDPRFGTLADADALIERAHELGLRVMVDIVPNHSSSEHPWFQEALAVGAGECRAGSLRLPRRQGRERRGAAQQLAEQLRRPSLGAGDRVRTATPGQWYLHLFDRTQPDFDWTNPEVGDEMESVLRFWLDRGADGFRIDVAHGLVKVPGLPDAPPGHEIADTERTADLPDVGPARRARHLPPLAQGRPTPTPSRARTPTASSAPRRGWSRPSRWRCTCGPTSCTSRSTSPS